jgi:hypothetical protein
VVLTRQRAIAEVTTASGEVGPRHQARRGWSPFPTLPHMLREGGTSRPASGSPLRGTVA